MYKTYTSQHTALKKVSGQNYRGLRVWDSYIYLLDHNLDRRICSLSRLPNDSSRKSPEGAVMRPIQYHGRTPDYANLPLTQVNLNASNVCMTVELLNEFFQTVDSSV